MPDDFSGLPPWLQLWIYGALSLLIIAGTIIQYLRGRRSDDAPAVAVHMADTRTLAAIHQVLEDNGKKTVKSLDRLTDSVDELREVLERSQRARRRDEGELRPRPQPPRRT